MKIIKIQKKILFLLLIMILSMICLPLGYYAGRPLPFSIRSELYKGVIYYRQFHLKPRLFIAHIVTVDLNTPGLEFIVTPGDPNAEIPLRAMTTSEFARKFNVQVAINGDGFTPWYSNGIFSYYPHPGDGVTPNGQAISRGIKYHENSKQPTIFFTATNRISFFPPGEERIFNALSGDRIIVENNSAVTGLDDQIPAPRTAIGLNGEETKLIIVVVDGRQPFYSQGASMFELAEIMMYYGAATALNLDGGGSSTLVAEKGLGVKVLNSPIDRNIPGFERAVANHLGIIVP